jgi:hypothetical protein
MEIRYKNILKLIVIGILGLFGASFIFLLTIHHGAGISPDSVAYISVARNIANGIGFITYDGDYFVLQPPIYPLLLASVKLLLSIDPVVSAGYFNSIFFGLIIYLSGIILLKHLKSFTLVILGTVSVLISYALVQASLMALSETLFIFLVLLFLHYIEIYRVKRNFVSLIFLSISSGLACLTRYTGVILVLTGIIGIFFFGKNNSTEFRIQNSEFRISIFKGWLWQCLIFFLISIVPVGIWILRNYLLSGTLVGQRASSSFTLFDNLIYFYHTVLPWYLPPDWTVIYFIIIIIIVTAWILFDFERVKSSTGEAIDIIGPSLLFVLFYSGIIIISSTFTGYDRIADRLLSPIYIPLIFVLFFISDKILSWLTRSFHYRIISIIYVIGLVLLIRIPVYSTKYIIEEYISLAGREYSSEQWRESKTIEYLNLHQSLGKNYTIYSNEPEAVYILTNLKTMRSPIKTFYNSNKLFHIYPNQKDIWPNPQNICLVWFDSTNHSFLYKIEELQKNINMTEVAHLKDGEIYTFSSK